MLKHGLLAGTKTAGQGRRVPLIQIPLLGAMFVQSVGLAAAAAGADAGNPELEQLLELSIEDLMHVPVTVASRFTETDLDIGSTVSVVTEKDWQKRGARRLHDAIDDLPSTMVLPNFFGADNISIRGYAFSNSISGVATLWDGVPLNTLQSGTAQFNNQNINLGTLDRIEMIRGPGSALYGEDAFHGVFALSSFESEQDISRVSGEVASNGYYQAGLKDSREVMQGLRLNVSAAFSGQPDQDMEYDYTDPVTGQNQSSEREFQYQTGTAVIKLISDPKRDASYRLGLYWDKNDSDDFAGVGARAPPGRDVGDSNSTFYMTQGGIAHKLPLQLSAELNGYYWHQDHEFKRALTPDRDLIPTADEHQWGVNLTLKQSELFGNTRWSAVLGTRHAHIEQAEQKIKTTGGDRILKRELPFSGVDREIYSLALDADTAFLNDKLHVRYGGRIDHYSDFGTETSPRLAIIYHPTSDSAIKLLYGNAFRAPIGVEIEGAATIEGDSDIKAENIDTYELVFQKQAPEWKAEVVFFTSKWEDTIDVVPTTTPGFFGKFANTGDNEAYGAEASFMGSFDKWTLNTNASYVRSENQDTNDDYVAFPKVIVNLGVGYQLTHKTSFFVNNLLRFDADEGPINTIDPNPDSLGNYWRTDVHVSSAVRDKLTLFANIRNLFNRNNYFPSVQNAENGIPDESFSISMGLRYSL